MVNRSKIEYLEVIFKSRPGHLGKSQPPDFQLLDLFLSRFLPTICRVRGVFGDLVPDLVPTWSHLWSPEVVYKTWKSVLFDLHCSWKSALFDLEGLVLNKTIIVFPRHKAITTCLVCFIVSAAEERLASPFSSLDDEVSIATTVTL